MKTTSRIVAAAALVCVAALVATPVEAGALERQSVSIAGLRFPSAYGEVEVQSAVLTVSWEARATPNPGSRTIEVCLEAEAWSAAGAERFVLRCSKTCALELGRRIAPAEAVGWIDVSVPFLMESLDYGSRAEGTLGVRILFASGTIRPAVAGVSLVQV